MRNHDFDALKNIFLAGKGSRVSRPDQKVGLPSGTFRTTVISKNVVVNLGPVNLWPKILGPVNL